MYLADISEAAYTQNRLYSCRTMKRLECSAFIKYTVEMMQQKSWSPKLLKQAVLLVLADVKKGMRYTQY